MPSGEAVIRAASVRGSTLIAAVGTRDLRPRVCSAAFDSRPRNFGKGREKGEETICGGACFTGEKNGAS